MIVYRMGGVPNKVSFYVSTRQNRSSVTERDRSVKL